MTISNGGITLSGVWFISAALVLMTACGGDSDSGEYGSNDSRVAGNFSGTTVINRYEVTSTLNVDRQGDVLGLAANVANTNQPNTVYTVSKGNIYGGTLYEFDLVDPSINKYKASGSYQNGYNQLVFNFSNIPTSLNRPNSLTAYRTADSKALNLRYLIGSYDALTLDLFRKGASTLNISNHSSNDKLNLRYTGSDGCLIEGDIVRQTYQTNLFDVAGTFFGNTCIYRGQRFEGVITYDNRTQEVIMFGSTDNNSNALVVSAFHL